MTCVSTFEMQVYLIGGGIAMGVLLLLTVAILLFRSKRSSVGDRWSDAVDPRLFEVSHWIDNEMDEPDDQMFKENG